MLDWLATYWELVLLGVVLVSSVLNVITQHYGEAHPALKRALLFVVDLMSVLTSRGSPGTMKLPLKASPPPVSDIRRRVQEIKECKPPSK